jgi:hypothetical protein
MNMVVLMVTINSNNMFLNFLWTLTFCVEKSYDGKVPRTWWDFETALPFQTRLTQTKPVLPLPNEHGSQVKEQGRRQYCHTKHKKFPYRPTRDVSLLSGHTSYKDLQKIHLLQIADER